LPSQPLVGPNVAMTTLPPFVACAQDPQGRNLAQCWILAQSCDCTQERRERPYHGELTPIRSVPLWRSCDGRWWCCCHSSLAGHLGRPRLAVRLACPAEGLQLRALLRPRPPLLPDHAHRGPRDPVQDDTAGPAPSRPSGRASSSSSAAATTTTGGDPGRAAGRGSSSAAGGAAGCAVRRGTSAVDGELAQWPGSGMR